MAKVKYNCKDNDCKLRFIIEDEKIDEVWIGIKGDTSFTIVGYDDLLSGIKKALRKVSKIKRDKQ